MAEEDLKLLPDDGKKPPMPLMNAPDSEEINKLKSQDIKEAIGGEYVKQVQIPSDVEMFVPNYVIDFRKMKTVHNSQIEAIQGIIVDDGDVAIYAWLGNGLVKLGMAIDSKISSILPAGVQSIFDKKCRLYQDLAPGKKVKDITASQDISKIRLDL